MTTITGTDGADMLTGNFLDNTLSGGNGNDTLSGAGGNDTLRGGEGNDFLNGQSDDDLLSGGQGSDEFSFSGGWGSDTITDFDPASDTITLDTDVGLAALASDLTEVDGNVVISDGDGNSVTLQGISLAEFDLGWLKFRDPFADGFEIGTQTDIDGGGNAITPSIAMLENGNLIAIWQLSGSGDDPIQGRLLDQSGNPISDVLDFGESQNGEARVVALTGGGFAVTNHINISTQIRVYDEDANLITIVQNEVRVGGGGEHGLMATADGGFVLLIGGTTVSGQRYDADGNVVGTRFDISGSAPNDNFSTNTYTGVELEGGGYAVVWDFDADGSDYGVWVRLLDEDLLPVGDAILVNTTTEGRQSRPDVAALADGGFVVAWRDSGSEDDAFIAQVFDESGNKVGGEIAVDTPPGDHTTFRASVEGLSDGGFIVGWSYLRGSFYDAAVRTFNGAGEATSDILILPDGGSSVFSYYPDLVFNEAGAGFVITYTFDNDIQVRPLHAAVEAGDTADEIRGLASSDYIAGFADSDTLSGGDGDDTLVGGNGSDRLYGDGGSDTLLGGNAGDRLYGGAGGDWLDGGAGDDLLDGGSQSDQLKGGAGNDVLFGGTQADRLDGGEGADSLFGGNGNDTVLGGSGSDTLSGSIGDDSLNGGGQGDRLFGDAGADTLNGGGGSDRAEYLVSADAILVDLETGEATGGFADGDVLISIESLFGGKGDDTLRALEAGSRLNGAGGNDIVTGRSGDDLLAGGNGNDVVTGGAGDDLMNGNRGDDTLDGGAGDDTLRGSAGSDTFIFSDGTGDDIVLDFRANDLLDLSDTTTDFTSLADVQAAATETEAGLLIDLGGGDSVLLISATLTELTADNLIF